jgi:hypothetical protein
VLGEFYWTVARGETTETDDYVQPPRMLSKETTREKSKGKGKRGEVNWSLGTYLPADELWKAFGQKGDPPEPEGVAPHQPSPFKESIGPVWKSAALAAAAIFLVFVFLSAAGGKTLHRESVSIPPVVAPGSPEAATFAGPFFVTSDGNLQVKVQAPVSNSWLYLDGALINEETGAVDEFDLEVSYYSGTDSDGSWSEGSTTSAQYIPTVPPGRYTLRLEPQWETGQRPPGRYDLTVTSRVPRFYHLFLAALALLAWPAGRLWRYLRFETARWSESDHPWVESSDDEEDE